MEQEFLELFSVEAFRRYAEDPDRKHNTLILRDGLLAKLRATAKQGILPAAIKEKRVAVQRQLERLSSSEDRVKELSAHLANPPPDAVSADGQFVTSKTVYRYTSGLPSRRFAVGLAAQGLSRRHLEHLLDSTIDLDIANCMFTLVTQLIDMLKPTKTGHAYIDGLLDFPSFRAAAKDRDTALAHIASVVGKAAAKQINLQMAGGGAIPSEFRDNPYLQSLSKEAKLLR